MSIIILDIDGVLDRTSDFTSKKRHGEHHGKNSE
jgi:hypothetical protein